MDKGTWPITRFLFSKTFKLPRLILIMAENIEEIRKEAKKIMDSFVKALGKIDEKLEIPAGDLREEKESKGRENETFRKIFFENAPEVRDDSIVAERGKWK